MPFLMIRNDITKVSADVIVNPANSKLLQGSGTSRSIYVAAGEALLTEACEDIGYCEMGKVAVTSAFNLPAKYIFHAVAPAWEEGKAREEETLYHTYEGCLRLAIEKKCESIAFPLISSGNLGFPKEKAMSVAIKAISDFLMENDLLVYMVLYDRKSVSVSQKLLGTIEEYIDDNYIAENDEILYDNLAFDQSEEFDHFDGSDSFVESRQENFPGNRRRFLRELRPREVLRRGTVTGSKIDTLSAPSAVPSLGSGRSLESLMEKKNETFSQMLLRLIDERGLKDSYVYKKANVDRRHFSKIRNDVNYAPNKKTVMAFAIALELSLDEAVDLMNRAGFAFSRCSKFDIIIRFFLENHSYDIFEINEVLFAYDQPILGE